MTTENKQPKRPTHDIFQVIGEKPNSRWVKVGAAWPNKDGKGMHLRFDAFPLTGRIMMREIGERADAEKGGQQ